MNETDRALSVTPKASPIVPWGLLYKTDLYELNQDQKQAIIEVLTEGAGFCILGVGAGKTLLSFLLTKIFDLKTILLCPADLRDNAHTEFDKFKNDFEIKMPLLCSYGQLSVSNFTEYLDREKPELIIADEAHKLKSCSSVRTKRLFTYLLENPSTRFIGMTGTVTTKSLEEYAHLFEAALGDRTPIPRDGEHLDLWNDHLSPRAKPLEWQWDRLEPLANKYGESLRSTRIPTKKRRILQRAYCKHLTQASGVHFSTKPSVGASLVIYEKKGIDYPDKLKQLEKDVKEAKCLPNGEFFANDAQEAKTLFEIAHGFYYVWDWSGVAKSIRFDWTYARSDWQRALRSFLVGPLQKRLDAPSLIERRIESGSTGLPGWLVDSYRSWAKIRHKCSPKTIPIWVDDYLVRYAREFLAASNDTILWYHFKAFADKLRPYVKLYEAGDKLRITKHKCAMSLAHATGNNLQAWNNQLFITPMASGERWEQALGRTHRQGQLSDTVTASVPQHHPIFVRKFRQAQEDARYIQETTGAAQKLCYASYAKRIQKGWNK